MAQSTHLRKYGVETTFVFELYEVDGVDLRVDWVPAAADCEVMKDEGASTQCTNTATDEGSTYSIVLTATEMQAARLVLKVVDAATKAFLDKVIIIETYGHASAMHAMDLDDAVRGGMTALPNAAADAAGGLIISDAGGLDADNQVVDGLKAAGIVLTTATIETVTSQTQLVIPATADATDDDAYNGALAVIIDGTDPNQRSFRLVTDYASGTRTVTLSAAADFVVTTSDTVVILAGATSTTVWDRVLTGATHNLASSAGRRLRNIQDFGIYDMASVWVDEDNGTSTGTVDGEDATVTNRADDFDNAQTVAASVGIDAIHIQNGNAITLTGALDGFNIWSGAAPGGDGWSLALGSQSIANTCVSGATVTGVGTGASPCFANCVVGNVTLPPCKFQSCLFTGTTTVGSAGHYLFDNCASDVPGSSAPVVDMGGAVGATTISFRKWSGGLTINNVQAGDVISVDVISGGAITVNGTGGEIHVRGMCHAVDSSGGSVSITETSVVNMTKIGTANAAALTASTISEPGAPLSFPASINSALGWCSLVATGKKIQSTAATTVYAGTSTNAVAASTISMNTSTLVLTVSKFA